MEGISIKLPSFLSYALAAEARRRNVTQSLIVREALERCLLDHPNRAAAASCADLVQDLVGSSASGRSDLGTNKVVLRAAVESQPKRGRKRRR